MLYPRVHRRVLLSKIRVYHLRRKCRIFRPRPRPLLTAPRVYLRSDNSTSHRCARRVHRDIYYRVIPSVYEFDRARTSSDIIDEHVLVGTLDPFLIDQVARARYTLASPKSVSRVPDPFDKSGQSAHTCIRGHSRRVVVVHTAPAFHPNISECLP